MSQVIIPNQDTFYEDWIQNFATVATTNATALGLSSGQTTALNALATAFSTALSESTLSKLETKSKVVTKDNARTVSQNLFRNTAKTINANANIADGLKASLGITMTPTSAGPVTIPSGLEVVSSVEGINQLTWLANGNAKATTYILEFQLPGETAWNYLTVVTAKKYDHTGQTPGQQVAYRVSAKRSGIQSAFCLPVVAFFTSTDSESATLKVA